MKIDDGGEGKNRTYLGLLDRPITVLKTAETTRYPSLSLANDRSINPMFLWSHDQVDNALVDCKYAQLSRYCGWIWPEAAGTGRQVPDVPKRETTTLR